MVGSVHLLATGRLFLGEDAPDALTNTDGRFLGFTGSVRPCAHGIAMSLRRDSGLEQAQIMAPDYQRNSMAQNNRQ